MPKTSCTQERKEKGSEKVAKKEKEPEVKQLAPGFKEGEKARIWASGFRLIYVGVQELGFLGAGLEGLAVRLRLNFFWNSGLSGFRLSKIRALGFWGVENKALTFWGMQFRVRAGQPMAA